MMKNLLCLLTTLFAAGDVPHADAAGPIASGEYYITQSWTQETAFARLYCVSIPETETPQRVPVFIFLHGHGGNAKEAMRRFISTHPVMATRYAMVFPEGYRGGWNVMSEATKADDRAFMEAIVKKLATHTNIAAANVSVMGNSNGAALVNQLAIESRLPNFRNYVTAVSPLNVYQHDGVNFKAKGADNNYDTIAIPMTGKRLMNISGTDDKLVPYHGGLSPAIPAKEGTLGFLDAEESTFLWAKRMGYTGERLSVATDSDGEVARFSYLNGDVVHYKVINGGHDAAAAIPEARLLAFLERTSDNREQRLD